jgi:hypothetical protein
MRQGLTATNGIGGEGMTSTDPAPRVPSPSEAGLADLPEDGLQYGGAVQLEIDSTGSTSSAPAATREQTTAIATVTTRRTDMGPPL